MIGRTRIVCAITIAGRREQQAELAERAGARKEEVDEQADDHRREAHQSVEQHDQRPAPGKPADGQRRAQRQAEQRRQRHRG